MFTGEVDIKRISEIRDLCADHISGFAFIICLSTIFTPIDSIFFNDFLAAIVVRACRIIDSVLVLNSGNITIDSEDMSIVIVVFFSERLFNLTNQL